MNMKSQASRTGLPGAEDELQDLQRGLRLLARLLLLQHVLQDVRLQVVQLRPLRRAQAAEQGGEQQGAQHGHAVTQLSRVTLLSRVTQLSRVTLTARNTAHNLSPNSSSRLAPCSSSWCQVGVFSAPGAGSTVAGGLNVSEKTLRSAGGWWRARLCH